MEKSNQLTCERHLFDKNNLQFICLNQNLPEGLNRLLCQYCLEDSGSQSLILASIDGLKISNKVLNQWPPLHQQINLKGIQQKHFSLGIQQIEEFYDRLKDKVCLQIEKQKKYDIKLYNEISNNQDFIQKYYEASEFLNFSRIIEKPNQSLQGIQQQLEDLIKMKYLQIDQNQALINSFCEKNLYKIVDEGVMSRIQEEILEKLSQVSYFEKFQQSDIIQNMIQCNYADSNQIQVLKNNGRIQLIPSRILVGQLCSEQWINPDLIYEFIIGFNAKPSNYICIGFEEESLKNRYLGNYGRNSFILGQINELFCDELVKGNTNLQQICENEFVENIIIQVKLSENKFYISDYPLKRAVNCMNQNQYRFKHDQKYYLTILIHDQNTQVEIKSSRIINNFTLL